MFGLFRKSRQKRSEDFISGLKSKDDDYLKGAYSMLDTERQLHPTEFTNKELRAVEDELNNRGYEYMVDY